MAWPWGEGMGAYASNSFQDFAREFFKIDEKIIGEGNSRSSEK